MVSKRVTSFESVKNTTSLACLSIFTKHRPQKNYNSFACLQVLIDKDAVNTNIWDERILRERILSEVASFDSTWNIQGALLEALFVWEARTHLESHFNSITRIKATAFVNFFLFECAFTPFYCEYWVDLYWKNPGTIWYDQRQRFCGTVISLDSEQHNWCDSLYYTTVVIEAQKQAQDSYSKNSC